MRLITVMSAGGTATAFAWGGWRAGVAFALGAAAAWLNFRWLRKGVDALGHTVAANKKPPRARVAVMMGLRYLLLGAAGYVIVKYSTLNLTAALVGLFVPVAAVLLEILVELVYASTS